MADTTTDLLPFNISNPRNCTWMVEVGLVHNLQQANTDVAGIGVIIAFMVTAYITYFSVVGAYLGGYIDPRLLRPIDTLVHRVPEGKHFRDDARKPLQAFVLLLSDQQLVTGIAIMIAGFIGMFRDNMMVYHFQIVIYLGWMASSVHLSALTMLSGFLPRHSPLMWWRLAGMTVLLVLLSFALVPTASAIWATDDVPGHTNVRNISDITAVNLTNRTGWAVPSRCYFFKNHGYRINSNCPLAFIILIVSYIWKAIGLSRTSHELYRRWLRRPWESRLENFLRDKALTKDKRRWSYTNIVYNLVMIIYVHSFLQNELFTSFAASMHISWIGLGLGTVQIIVPRAKFDYWSSEENQWGFGQIIPLILLIQPMGLIFEHMRQNKKEKDAAADAASSSHGTYTSDSSESHSEVSSLVEAAETPLPDSPLAADTSPDSATEKESLSLSQHFAMLPTERDDCTYTIKLPAHQRAIYDSRTFKSLVWATEICGTIWVVAFYVIDARGMSIDTQDSNNDFKVIIGAALTVVLISYIVLLFSLPFSRLFK
ncbi:hypothetical protein ANO11243_027630 [Dothideomycetidae sp. 11243]|nr:hypothetical protein ANO11243_027630 [fungal sp. No.11243]